MPNNQNVQMYKIDLNNLTGLSEKSKIELEKQINIIEQQKKFALDKNIQNLNNEIIELQTINTNSLGINQLSSKQEQELSNIENKLNNNDLNISTIKRQLEISMNNTDKKNNLLFFLKLVLIYLLLSTLSIIVMKNNLLSDRHGIYLLSIISFIFIVLILINLFKIRNRNSIKYNKINFHKPNAMNILGNKNNHGYLNNIHS
jgi:hypothetical protein